MGYGGGILERITSIKGPFRPLRTAFASRQQGGAGRRQGVARDPPSRPRQRRRGAARRAPGPRPAHRRKKARHRPGLRASTAPEGGVGLGAEQQRRLRANGRTGDAEANRRQVGEARPLPRPEGRVEMGAGMEGQIAQAGRRLAPGKRRRVGPAVVVGDEAAQEPAGVALDSPSRPSGR